jgi:outer membrane protein TolC
MTTLQNKPRATTLVVAMALLVLSGCASVNFDNSLAKANQDASDFTKGKLELAQTQEQRSAQEKKAAQYLAQPLSQGDAVQLALVNSPALQAMLAQNWADAANAAQTGRIVNPTFTFERSTFLDEVEIGRRLTFGLLDLITLPQRLGIAERGIARAQIQLTSDVVDQVTQVRQAWVKAVAAKQNLMYAQQVNDAAEVSADLARRLQAVGNFTKLQRARQQAFYADAATQFASAQHDATATREALNRALGLTEAQSKQLKLPDRLPDLPKTPSSPEDVSKAANAGRLDIKLAQSALESAAKAQGLTMLTSLTDIELGIRRDTVFDNAAGTETPRHGYEISMKLPIFDFGGLRRDAMNAQTLAVANRLEATVRSAGSNLRESYSAYRTAYDIARHYRDEVVPLRKTIAEESVLRYNGMIIGVFELLADSKDQISSVMAAIAAEQQFWLADAALQASQMGKPTSTSVGSMVATGSGGGDAGH